MQVVCSRCSHTLEYSGERPSFCAYCGHGLTATLVEQSAGIDPQAGTVHYRRAGIQHVEATAAGWLPASGPVCVGVTAGASTPNNKIGDVVRRVLATRGLQAPG